jgi:DNA topoisomerase-3
MLEAFSETSQKDVLTVTLHGADVDFVLKAEKVTYPGWKAVLNEKEEDEDKEVEFLPDFKEGENIRISSLKETEHKTKPKPLFTEATLLSAMENAGREIEDGEVRKAMDGCGIGTPATRANIIETLLLREYIRREKKTLVPTDKGMAVYDIVKDKRIANAEMTGMWELALAKIENGENDAARFNQEIKDYTGQICTELLESSIISKDNTELLTCPVCKNNSVKIYPKVAKCTSEGCEFRVFREVCGKSSLIRK